MKITQSKMVLELLSKTLEFYADQNNYKRRPTDNDTDTVSYMPSAIDVDKGQKAEQTLRNIKEIINQEL